MTRGQQVSNVVMAALIMLLPFAFAPARYLRPEPWIVFLAMCTILLTQPAIDPREMVDKSALDRLSALAIYLGQIGAQLAAVLDFGYWHGPAPRLVSMLPIAGLILLVGGLAFRVWAIRTLGRFFTSTVQVQQGQTVVDWGPYRLLRHPSYTGALLGALGATLVLNSLVGAALVFLLSVPAYLVRMGTEERALAGQIGEPYREYMRRTKRLIPLVY
jgi:protein-S-isoprenylcysteine O-methyltransferase Ste14